MLDFVDYYFFLSFQYTRSPAPPFKSAPTFHPLNSAILDISSVCSVQDTCTAWTLGCSAHFFSYCLRKNVPLAI